MIPSPNLLWSPSQARASSSKMHEFAVFAAARTGQIFSSYQDLHAWSVKDLSGFWQLAAEFFHIQWHNQPQNILQWREGAPLQSAQWFVGGTLNYAQHLLRPWQNQQKIAITSYVEGVAKPVTISGEALCKQVAACAAYLCSVGVAKGDRVAGVMANVPQAIVAMLASASLGAIWSSCSPDFGALGIAQRFAQIEPKVLFATASYIYGGKTFFTESSVMEAWKDISSKPKIVWVDHLEKGHSSNAGVSFEQIIESGTEVLPLTFEPLSFQDPLFILFSSGTTGVPKCITHGVGGTLLQHAKEHVLHSDLGPDDHLLFFTTCGWMMWNWMVSALQNGTRLTLYEGSPAHPQSGALWRVAAEAKVTALGTSPRYLSSCMSEHVAAQKYFADASALRLILTTGSPLLVPHFAWIYEQFPDVHLASISGGTDIIGCFMLGSPTLPVRSGEIQCLGLGMSVEAWDDAQKPVRDEKGELVCTKPFPSMPVCFWNDQDGSKYQQAYFNYYLPRHIWRHGDFISITASGGVIVHGRSDATLNPGGVRIGTAEIYRQLETLRELSDSMAVAWRKDPDEHFVLLVKLTVGQVWNADLEKKIRRSLKEGLSPRHVPKYIFPVTDLPYNRSGKKMEIAAFQALHGEEIKNLAAVANPCSLDGLKQLNA